MVPSEALSGVQSTVPSVVPTAAPLDEYFSLISQYDDYKEDMHADVTA
jgi:hypothetical protein